MVYQRSLLRGRRFFDGKYIYQRCHPTQYRYFFASSTDHTNLLQTAQVHRLDDDTTSGTSNKCQYVMAADGMEVDVVKKVPQLHLARLYREGPVIYGAKVVNSTLGSPELVCGRLLDAALEDARLATTNDQPQILAKAALHGLSEWVLKNLNKTSIDTIASMEEKRVKVLEDILNDTGIHEDIYEKIKLDWEKLAQEFLGKGQSEEAILYESKGGVFSEIIHHADTSDYASSSLGAMATYTFP